MFGSDGAIKMTPKNKRIKYLGDNIYDVTDEEGKNFLVDENGNLKADFSLPGVEIQGQKIITDSFEERNAWIRRVTLELKAKYLERIAEIEEQSSAEIKRLKADCDKITEYSSEPSYTLPKN